MQEKSRIMCCFLKNLWSEGKFSLGPWWGKKIHPLPPLEIDKVHNFRMFFIPFPTLNIQFKSWDFKKPNQAVVPISKRVIVANFIASLLWLSFNVVDFRNSAYFCLFVLLIILTSSSKRNLKKIIADMVGMAEYLCIYQDHDRRTNVNGCANA